MLKLTTYLPLTWAVTSRCTAHPVPCVLVAKHLCHHGSFSVRTLGHSVVRTLLFSSLPPLFSSHRGRGRGGGRDRGRGIHPGRHSVVSTLSGGEAPSPPRVIQCPNSSLLFSPPRSSLLTEAEAEAGAEAEAEADGRWRCSSAIIGHSVSELLVIQWSELFSSLLSPPLFSSHRGRGRGGGRDRGRGRWVARPLRRRRIMVKRTRVDNVCLVLHLTVTLLPPPPSDSRPLRCARVAVCRRHCGHRCCLLHGSGTRIGRRPIRQSHHFRCLCPLTSRVRWPRRWPGPRRGA